MNDTVLMTFKKIKPDEMCALGKKDPEIKTLTTLHHLKTEQKSVSLSTPEPKIKTSRNKGRVDQSRLAVQNQWKANNELRV